MGCEDSSPCLTNAEAHGSVVLREVRGDHDLKFLWK
jgi:hypothetical protein